MADLSGVSANHVYAPGRAPVEENPYADALIDFLVLIGPAILIILTIILVLQRVRDVRQAKQGDGLSPKRRAEIAEKQQLRAIETRQEVQRLRKEREQKTSTV